MAAESHDLQEESTRKNERRYYAAVLKYILLLCSFFYSFAAQPKSVLIFTLNRPEHLWDPESIAKGITGSEEAVIYVAQSLVRLGYQVEVLGNPPADSEHSKEGMNPRYIPMSLDDGKKYDIAIAWRYPTIGSMLKKRAAKVYYWPHDHAWIKPSAQEIEAFDGVLWLSEWQRRSWVSQVPEFAKFTLIYGNGINPKQFRAVEERENPYACIYGSNYARGLEILLEVWPRVKRVFPKATLDLYYGWQHWGLMTSDKEAELREKVRRLENLGVKDHGMVGHEELNRAYEQASLWTYPCTHPETFCITALRAQLSGAVPVIIEGTALAETVKHGYRCNSPNQYLPLLLNAMREAEKISLEERRKMGNFVLEKYTWDSIAAEWKNDFEKNF